jgi:WXXGXW repeat (2 copies)
MGNIHHFRGALIFGLLIAGQICVAQEVIIRERPVRPRYERVVAPSPRHIWIEEEWEPRGATYVFVGGRWAEPPAPGMEWIPGHWAQRPRGEVWIRGHWRERRHR